MLSLKFYDYSITVADEIDLIWFAPWGAGKGLFFLNRYLPFIEAPLWLYRKSGALRYNIRYIVFPGAQATWVLLIL